MSSSTEKGKKKIFLETVNGDCKLTKADISLFPFSSSEKCYEFLSRPGWKTYSEIFQTRKGRLAQLKSGPERNTKKEQYQC